MTQLSKNISFQGLEDLVTEDNKPFCAELVRRLERYANNLLYQFQSHPTLFNNDAGDPPTGMKTGDIWANADGVYRYTGSEWAALTA